MEKKKIIGIIALIVIIAIIVLLVFLVKPPKTQKEILLKDGATLTGMACLQLPKVMVIHATGCSACAIALPRLRELEQELNLSFSYYDITIEEQREQIIALGLIPQAVPTVITNCKVYVGVKSKEEYKKAIIG